MTEDNSFLPACPCCGGKAEIEQDEFGEIVRCIDCGVNTGGEYSPNRTEEAAVSAWSKRVTKIYTE